MPTVGAWTTYSCPISKELADMFTQAVKLAGVNYTPVAVATQVVSGMNYRFFCNAEVVYPGSTNQAAIVEIYQSPAKSLHVTKIHMIDMQVTPEELVTSQ